MYTVIKDFTDRQTLKTYKVGDTYNGNRVAELSSKDNGLGEPLIKEVRKEESKKEDRKGIFK